VTGESARAAGHPRERAEGFTVERRSLGDDDGETLGRCITVHSSQALVRKRFTIAHELSHFVMHSDHGADDDLERQADVFASALLMPRDALRREPPVRALRLPRARAPTYG
jgi:hypothetical protein